MDEDHFKSITVSPCGDLKLLVDSNEPAKRARHQEPTKPITKTLIVSSAVMRHASPVWSTMFDPEGYFLEANSFAAGRQVRFNEDDTDALLLVLRISHLMFSEIPATLDYNQLLNLAVICDKYDTVKLIRPWLPQWEESLKLLACEPGYENYLFISWAFGDDATYQKLSKLLVSISTTDGMGQCFRSGRPLWEIMPPGTIDSILEARRVTIAALLDMCYKLVDCYQTNQTICEAMRGRSHHRSSVPNDVKQECDALVFGSLIKGLKQLGIWPGPVSPDDVHKSVTDLIGGLRSLRCFALMARYDNEYHDGCKFTIKIDTETNRIGRDVLLSGVDGSHLKHMEEQAKK